MREIKFRPKWCTTCKYYLPAKGASSHKCLSKNEVFIGESKIKCYAYTKRLANNTIEHPSEPTESTRKGL